MKKIKLFLGVLVLSGLTVSFAQETKCFLSVIAYKKNEEGKTVEEDCYQEAAKLYDLGVNFVKENPTLDLALSLYRNNVLVSNNSTGLNPDSKGIAVDSENECVTYALEQYDHIRNDGYICWRTQQKSGYIGKSNPKNKK